MNYSTSNNSGTLVRVLLAVSMIALFMSSIFTILESSTDKASEPQKLWFGVAHLSFVAILAFLYVGLIVMRTS